jgi:hypothetical protein
MLRWFAKIGAALKKPIPEPTQVETDVATNGSTGDAQQAAPVATSPDAAAPASTASPTSALAVDEQIVQTEAAQQTVPVAAPPDAAAPVSAAPSTGARAVDVQIVRAEIAQEAVSVATPSDDTAAISTATSTAAFAVEEQVAKVARGRDAAPIALEQQEIQRRRELVRTFFNDFWQGRDDKPATFSERLDQAETYLNERLVASGESWRVDADARKILSLPARSSQAARDTSATP